MWVNGDPRLDALRADSRYEQLLRRIGLEPAQQWKLASPLRT